MLGIELDEAYAIAVRIDDHGAVQACARVDAAGDLAAATAKALAQVDSGPANPMGVAATNPCAPATGSVVSSLAGLLAGGAVIAGRHLRAGSIAWLALNPVEREDYRKTGCPEAEVAAAGLVRRLLWQIKAGARSRVQDAVKDDLSAISVDHLLDAACGGDGVSISVGRDTAKSLGMAAATLGAAVAAIGEAHLASAWP